MSSGNSELDSWWREPDTLRWLCMIVFVAAVLRVAAMLDGSALPYFQYPLLDAAVFERGAARIVAGDLILAEQISVMNPGYFYVLALVRFVFGQGPWVIRAVQITMGLATIVLVFDASRRLFGKEKWSFLPPALLAIYTPAIFFEQQVLGESTALLLHAAVLDALLAAWARPTPRAFALIGALVGIAALLRPTALFLLGPALFVAFRSTGRRGNAAFLALATLLAIVPITARNVAFIGEPVLIASHGGVNLWVGNGEGANGAFRIPAEAPGADSPEHQFRAFQEAASRAEGRELGVAEADRYWTRRTVSWVLRHPIVTLRLLVRKLHLFWNGRDLSDVYRYEFLYERSPTLRVLLRFGWLAPWALVGLLVAASRRSEKTRIVAAIALVECLGVVLVMVTARYRLLTIAPLLLLVAVAAKAIADAVRARDSRRVLGLSLGMSIAGFIAWPIPVRDTRSSAWHELGESWAAVGDVEAALDAYEQAVAADPANLAALEDLAQALARRGHTEQARARGAELERSLRERGDLERAERVRQWGENL